MRRYTDVSMGISLHRAAPFAVFVAGITAGVALANAYRPEWSLCLVVLCILVMATVVVRHDELGFWVCLAAICATLGAARWIIADMALHARPTTALNGRTVVLEGLITDEPDARLNDTRLLVHPHRVVVDGTATAGEPGSDLFSNDVLIRVDKSITWRYGDVVRVIGRMEAPPIFSDFDFREYLARQRILSWIAAPDRVQRLAEGQGNQVWAAMLSVKDAVRRSVTRILPGPENALLNGILIGDARELPTGITDAFRATGTSHIVAISGFNVSLVINTLMLLLARAINKRRAALIALPVIVLYTFFVGATASVVRASAMAGIVLFGHVLWRRGFTLNTLCAAALLMIMWNPGTLFDPGFQLSVLATLGLVLYMDRIQAWVEVRVNATFNNLTQRNVAMFLLEGLLLTSAAQLLTLPLTLATYQSVSLVALLTNGLIVPLQPAIMGFGFVAAVIGMVSDTLGGLAALPAYGLLTTTLRIVAFMARIPGAMLPVYGLGGVIVSVYYAGLALLWVFTGLGYEHRVFVQRILKSRLPTYVLVTVACTGLALFVTWWFGRADGKLHVVFTGSGAFVQTPGGKQLVFASANGALLSEAGREMSFFDRQIEWVMLSQRTDAARGSLLPVVQRYAVANIIQPTSRTGAIDEPTAMLADWQALTSASKYLTATNDQNILLGDGVTGTVEPRLNGEIGLRITYGAHSFELVGDGDLLTTTLPAADIVMISPRARGLTAQLPNLAPRWVVWADSGGVIPSLNSPRVRALSLRETRVVEFVSDSRTLTLVQP